MASGADSEVNVNNRCSGSGACSSTYHLCDLGQITYVLWACFLISKIPRVAHSIVTILNKRIHGECPFGAWHRAVLIMTVIVASLLVTEEGNRALSPSPQAHQSVYCSSKLTKQTYDSHSIFLANLVFGWRHPE